MASVVKADQCFLQIASNGETLGQIKIKLRSDIVPKTADNFRFLCNSKITGYGYENTTFSRIIPRLMIQGGGDLKGKIKFDDENFVLKHEKFVFSMANSGKDSNGSEFFITMSESSW